MSSKKKTPTAGSRASSRVTAAPAKLMDEPIPATKKRATKRSVRTQNLN